ncbi:putative Uroporphyrinogen III synthase HEM4 [Candidatus Terasakiella magnetica]|uniref:Uroporphyrinogen-III synthase n=1 Tax=Candidatus Terasakiella magnetica TaxID=1867952 RepID=A0A1C3RFX4_9PROT|nr:uroporphyrinogen-III synthase [Candidatus Terasakiella magnetica]SCA56180.1 putative Uroporphyrinogen III synthase HEM4 [Candidatus Terasakiella magnetica]
MRILVTRPKEDAAPLVDLLKKAGHKPTLFPLLSIVHEEGSAKALSAYKVKDIQALLVTSANGVRAFAAADKRRSFKVMAVGDATAKMARQAGFKNVEIANGHVQSLAKLIKEKADPAKGKFLHIAGSRLAGDLKSLIEADGFDYERVVLYHADKTTELSTAIKNKISKGEIDAVMLYSPRTAAAFGQLIEKADLVNSLKCIQAYGLSEAVAAKIKHLPFQDIKTAPTPDQEALLGILSDPEDDSMTTDQKDDNKKTDPKPEAEKQKEEKATETVKPQEKKEEAKSSDVKKEDTKASNTASKPTEKKKTQIPNSKFDDPVQKALKTKPAQPKKKGSFKLKALAASVVILAGAGVGAYYTQDMWVPKVKAEIARVLKIEGTGSNAGVPDQMVVNMMNRLVALEAAHGNMSATGEAGASVDVQPLLDRIAQLEAALGDVKTGLSSIEIANGSEEKLAEFKELAAKIERAGTPDPVDLSGLEAENERLVQAIETLNERLAGVEAASLQARSSSDSAHALLAGFSALREAMRTSSSYAAELQTLGVLAQGYPQLERSVALLEPSARAGLVSLSSLHTSFETTAKDIVRAIAVPEGASWMEQTVRNLTSYVSIRRAPGNLDGAGPLGVVARAEHNVRAGDFVGALGELQNLYGKPLEVATPWMEATKARLTANAALAQLQANILALLSANGEQG